MVKDVFDGVNAEVKHETRILAQGAEGTLTENELALLRKAYETVYTRSFDPAYNDDLEYFIDHLSHQDPTNPMYFSVLGENLDDPEKAVIKGLAVGVYLGEAKAGVAHYLAVDPQFRGQKIAEQLVADRIAFFKAKAGGNLAGVFTFMRDPEIAARLGLEGVEQGGKNDPRPVLNLYDKNGGERIPVPEFFYPQSKEGLEATNMYLCGFSPVDGKLPDTTTSEKILVDYFKFVTGVSLEDAMTDPRFREDAVKFKTMLGEYVGLGTMMEANGMDPYWYLPTPSHN